MGRPNKHNLPPGLRFTDRDGYLIDVWYLEPEGGRRRYRERLGHISVTLARDLLARRRVDVIGGKLGIGPVSQTTVAEGFARYIEWAAVERPRSMKFRRHAEKRFTLAFGKRLLREVTPFLLERYKRDATGKGYSASTINLDITAMKHMLGRAVAWGLVGREIAAAVRDEVKLLPMDNERVTWLSPDQERALLGQCDQGLREMVIAGINLGARAGELRSLTWDRVDLAKLTLMLRRTKGRKATETRILINPPLERALKDAWARRTPKSHPQVFLTSHGRRWLHSWMGQMFREAADKAGLTGFRFHDLRHHFGSTLVQRGIGLQRVQRLLGHARITTTERYAHLAPDVDDATLAMGDSEGIGHLRRVKAHPRAKVSARARGTSRNFRKDMGMDSGSGRK